MAPETRYAKKGDISIAYQVVGDGPTNVVLSSGIVSHMALMWSEPEANAMLQRIASFARLILFDKPGTGLSDPVAGPPSAEQRAEDIKAVMDALDVSSAVILGYSEGGTAAVLFAAIYPERCDALVLLETAAKWSRDGEYLRDVPGMETLEYMFAHGADRWGNGNIMGGLWAPSAISVPGSMAVYGSAERICASPGMAKALFHACPLMDVRPVLSDITTPTLVLHREETFVPIGMGEFLAEHIPKARLARFPGKDHLIWVGAWEPIVDEIEEFLTGARHGSDPDRALATILFTDIVSSTERAADLGDERWRALVERHDEIIIGELGRYDGRPIKTLGDGFLAVFPGPAAAIRCARSIAPAVRQIGIEVRSGVHTGECDRRGEDLAGIAVNVAARIISHAGAGELVVSSTVKELVLGSAFEFTERGTHVLKGIPDEWRLFAVTGDRRGDARPVSEVSADIAALTPGPGEALRPRDKALLAAAHRMPGVLRTFGRPLFHRQRPWARRT
ncbi:MAG: alpha/beta fold hydrolase [Aeromicrobium sp.]